MAVTGAEEVCVTLTLIGAPTILYLAPSLRVPRKVSTFCRAHAVRVATAAWRTWMSPPARGVALTGAARP
jgi:hypothetical protein